MKSNDYSGLQRRTKRAVKHRIVCLNPRSCACTHVKNNTVRGRFLFCRCGVLFVQTVCSTSYMLHDVMIAELARSLSLPGNPFSVYRNALDLSFLVLTLLTEIVVVVLPTSVVCRHFSAFTNSNLTYMLYKQNGERSLSVPFSRRDIAFSMLEENAEKDTNNPNRDLKNAPNGGDPDKTSKVTTGGQWPIIFTIFSRFFHFFLDHVCSTSVHVLCPTLRNNRNQHDTQKYVVMFFER